MKYFYTHLVSIETVVRDLDELDLTEEQKIHLATLIDETIHHSVLDLIFSKLDYEDQVVFTLKLKEESDSAGILEFLKEKAEGIEEEIKIVADLLKEEFTHDIKEALRLGS